MKHLVIVESPSKSKTIEKYLGKDYKVISSKGHVRDLATTGKFGLGVDVENNFKPNYVPIKGKKKLITEMQKDVKNSDKVYLATDPDREGEAISWHLYDALGLKEDDYERVEFHEITKDVVKDAFNHTRKIDDNLVKSQETRRIIDRIIGFRLSKLMQSKTGGKSAGRVQSVALKLIVDREREIENFEEEEYYTIEAKFDGFDATLQKYKDKKIEIKSSDEADKILNSLDKEFNIQDIDTKEKNKKGKVPFKTSTLQKEASSKLGFGSSKTMRVAQKLYEGIDIGSETTGLITYMRTDSIRLSDIFVKETFDYIKTNFGSEYVGVVKKDYGNLKESISDKFNNVFMGHNNLSNEHNNLSNEHTQIQKQQNEIKQVVIYLKENTLCEQAKKEILSQQALDIQRTSEHISALVDLLHNTQIENLQLKQENQELKFKINQYEVQFNSEDEMEP